MVQEILNLNQGKIILKGNYLVSWVSPCKIVLPRNCKWSSDPDSLGITKVISLYSGLSVNIKFDIHY